MILMISLVTSLGMPLADFYDVICDIGVNVISDLISLVVS
jgi:hypothetical protein